MSPFPKLFASSGEKQQLLQSQEHVLSPHDSARVWEVKMPPIKADMVSGKLVPTVGSVLVPKLRMKKSRVTVEIHSDAPADKKDTTNVVEGLLRGKSMKEGVEVKKEKEMQNEEFVIMRIFRPKKKGVGGLFGFSGEDDHDKNEDDDDDEHSVSSANLDLSGVDKEFADGMWTEVYIYNLDGIEVLKRHRHAVELKLGQGNGTKVRDLVFANEEDATKFCDVLESLRKLEAGRAQRRLAKYLADPKHKVRDISSNVQLLVDIVSAVRLPVADILSTDAYVTVHLGKHKVHKTAYRPNSLNPIWTVDTGSLFLLEMTSEKFFCSGDCLMFSVYDFDAFGQDELLGRVAVSQEELLEGSGERVEFPFILDNKFKKARGAKLVLRFRQANSNDVRFMNTLAAHRKKNVVGAFASEAFVPIRLSHGVGFLKRETRKTKDGGKQFRVKPEPDPERPEETRWMTEEQMHAEALKPSTRWIQAGSGSKPMGKLYFEVIGCDELPNMDVGIVGMATAGVLAGKTDAYVCLIYEDSIVNTDVIYESLCPRWLPWTQRAFVFDIMHPSSQLMLAVLDYDAVNPMDDDDPIGRVTIDPSNLRPMTDYTMQFQLVTSSLVANRKMTGTITVRVRIEWENERKALIKSMKLPPQIYVNVSRHRDFLSSHYATVGEVNTKTFRMDTLTSYVDELQSYQAIVPVLREAVFTVLLWRGHLPVTIYVPSIPPQAVDPEQPSQSLLRRLFKPMTIKLPIHSMVAFLGGIFLAEDYNLFPSFLLFAIGWMLLGTMEYANNHPSPWRGKRTYLEHLKVLLFNRPYTDTIAPYEEKDDVEKYIAEEEQRQKEREEEAKAEVERAQQDAREQETEEAEVLIETEQKRWFGISLNVMEPILAPLQQHLGLVAVIVRIVRSYVMWEQSRSTFWIINICFVAGILLVGIPWDFLIHWSFRIVVWIFLGPWMKLVDILFVKGRTREELKEAAKKKLRLRYQQLVEARRSRQVKRENAMKLKSMKRYMFGDYIVGVPRFREDRFYDWPLYPSHARPHVDTVSPKIAASFQGQHLKLDIIPEREANRTTDESSSLKGAGDTKEYGSIEEVSTVKH